MRRGSPPITPLIAARIEINALKISFFSGLLEDGHENAEDAVRIYKWAQNRIDQSRALAGLTFSNKKICLPLAAADLFAYTAWGKEVGQKPIGIAKKRVKSEASYRGNAFRILLNRDSLNSLHEQAIMLANTGG
jgi:hypothetical protein